MDRPYPYGPIGVVRNPWKLWIVIILLSFLPYISIFFMVPLESSESNDPSENETEELDSMFFLTMILYIGCSVVVFIIEVWWMYTMYNELNIFRGYLHNPLLAACIPFFNIYAFYKYTEALEQEYNLRRMGKPPEPVLYCCLFFIFALGLPLLQSKMNELWNAISTYGDPMQEPPDSDHYPDPGYQH